jgi:hypothetical protein
MKPRHYFLLVAGSIGLVFFTNSAFAEFVSRGV